MPETPKTNPSSSPKDRLLAQIAAALREDDHNEEANDDDFEEEFEDFEDDLDDEFEDDFDDDFEDGFDGDFLAEEDFDDGAPFIDDDGLLEEERFAHLVPEEHGERSYAVRDYVEQYPRFSTERQLANLMTHVGLTGVDLSELGGNHPDAVIKAQAAAAARPDGSHPFFPASYTPQKKTPPYLTLVGEGTHEAIKEEESDPPKQDDPEDLDMAPINLGHMKEVLPGLDPIEQARRIQRFMMSRRQTPKDTAAELGWSRTHVLNRLRLLTLPLSIQDHIIAGRLTAGHGKAIAGMRDPEAAARMIISRDLSVRQAETLARRLRFINPDGTLNRDTAMPYTHMTERYLEDALGLKVQVKDRAGRGEVSIKYKSPEQAQMIFDKLGRSLHGSGDF